MTDVALFLSLAAGRAQGISGIRVILADRSGKQSPVQRIYMTYPWSQNASSSQLRSHPADVPLQPIQNPQEYRRVLTDWLSRQSGARTARYRYLACLRKGNRFDADRLIGAANMFDLLPISAGPASMDLSAELAKARDDARKMFKALSVSHERDSVLGALGRIGHPSLTRKVLHRVAMVEAAFPERFPALSWVAITAVKCRNAFVHGPSDDFDIERAEPFVPFLTEALEFIFGASDLLESGWNAGSYLKDGSVGGHSFARFRDIYAPTLAKLKDALHPAIDAQKTE
jgi:hypothetical protein